MWRTTFDTSGLRPSSCGSSPIGIPDARLLAMFPIVAAESRSAPLSPILPAEEPTYPIEQEFPDLADFYFDRDTICALWLGDAFEYSALTLACFTGIPAIAWPPMECGQDRVQWIRGIGRVWLGTKAECQAVIDRWIADARGALAGEALHPEDRSHIERILAFHSKWAMTAGR